MRIRVFAVLATLLLLPAAAVATGLEGWHLAACDTSSYAMDRDRVETYAGKPSGRLMSVRQGPGASEPCKGYGTMCQCIDPANYAGKRVRFTGYVKAREVKDWAGLWMRVDGPDPNCPTLAFDNMHTRPIKGSKGWARYDVVLDVAKGAKGICLGALLDGEGKVWLGGVTFETVDPTVPTTGDWMGRSRKPANLDFSH
jgi:hypothetical protein